MKARKRVRAAWTGLETTVDGVPTNWAGLHRELPGLSERVERFLARNSVFEEQAAVEEVELDIHRAVHLAKLIRELLPEHKAIRQSLGSQMSAASGADIRGLELAVRRFTERQEARLKERERATDNKKEVATTRQIAKEIRKNVELMGKALALLNESDELIRHATRDVKIEAMGAATQRDSFVEDLAGGELRPAAVAGFEEVLQALRAARSRPRPEPPPALNDAQRHQSEARRWASALKLRGAPDDLDERLEAAQVEFEQLGQSAIVELARRARERVESHTQQAASERERRLAMLDSECSFFMQRFGSDPDLLRRLEELRRKQVRSPGNHERWMKAEESLRKDFRQVAASFLLEMQESLASKTDKLESGCETIAGFSLRDDHHRELAELRLGVVELAVTDDVALLLDALRSAETLSERLHALREKSRAVQAELAAARKALEERYLQLREADRRFGWEVFSDWELLPASGENEVAPIQIGYAEAEAALAREGAELGQREAVMLRRVKASYVELFKRWEAGRDLLIRADLTDPVERVPLSGLPRELDGALGSLMDLDVFWAALEARIKELCASFRVEGAEIRIEIESIDDQALAPERAGLRQDCLDLLVDALEHNDDDDDLLSHAELLEEAVEQGRSFLHQHMLDKTKLVRMRKRLEQKLKDLSVYNLQRLYPDLHRQVAAMVHGLHTDVSRPGAQEQADHVEALLGSVEFHLMRLEAHQVSSHAQALRERLELEQDPRWCRQANNLLTRLERVGPYELPPVALRRRLRLLAQQAT
jgi:hypothetical protein